MQFCPTNLLSLCAFFPPGHQLRSQSLSEMYVQTLLRGCRCLELDCWPTGGGDTEDICITHGGTLCTKVTFKVSFQETHIYTQYAENTFIYMYMYTYIIIYTCTYALHKGYFKVSSLHRMFPPYNFTLPACSIAGGGRGLNQGTPPAVPL